MGVMRAGPSGPSPEAGSVTDHSAAEGAGVRETGVVEGSSERAKGRGARAARRAQQASARVTALKLRLNRLASETPVTDADLQHAAEAAVEAQTRAIEEYHHAADAHHLAAWAHDEFAEMLEASGDYPRAQRQRDAADADEAGAAADEWAANEVTQQNPPETS